MGGTHIPRNGRSKDYSQQIAIREVEVEAYIQI